MVRTPCHQGGAATSSCDGRAASPVLRPAAAPPPAPSRLQRQFIVVTKAGDGADSSTALSQPSLSQSCVQMLTGALCMLQRWLAAD